MYFLEAPIPTVYFTAEAMDLNAPLGNDTLLLIELTAKAISDNIVQQLRLDSQKIQQMEATGRFIPDVAHLDPELLGPRQELNMLGIRPPVIADISKYLDPHSPHPELHTDNTALVPARVIQLPDHTATREANAAFNVAFHTTVKNAVLGAINNAESEFVVVAFRRELELYIRRYKLKENAGCCIFRMHQDDYPNPTKVLKEPVASFSVACKLCEYRHEIKVVRETGLVQAGE